MKSDNFTENQLIILTELQKDRFSSLIQKESQILIDSLRGFDEYFTLKEK